MQHSLSVMGQKDTSWAQVELVYNNEEELQHVLNIDYTAVMVTVPAQAADRPPGPGQLHGTRGAATTIP